MNIKRFTAPDARRAIRKVRDPPEALDDVDHGLFAAFRGWSGPEPAPVPPPADIPSAVDRYRVLGVLGRGGMGVVLRVHDPLLDREVALKLLHQARVGPRGPAPTLLDEARRASRLQHPAIAPVYDAGVTEAGVPFFTMKIVVGRSFAEFLAGDASWSEHLRVFRRVADAVAFAHASGVVHGDLKPGNVLVGAFGEVVVVDWGLGAAAASAGAGQVIAGTPAYMAPEQARGMVDRDGRAVDVFALGAILCEILTGAPAYRGADAEQVHLRAAKAWQDDARARLAPCTPVELRDLALRCLAPAPEDRPDDVRQVVDSVEGYLADAERRAEEADRRAERERGRALEARRGRRVVLWLSGAILVLLIVGGAVAVRVEAGQRQRRADARTLVARLLRRTAQLHAAAEAKPFDASRWNAVAGAFDELDDAAARLPVDEETVRTIQALGKQLTAQRRQIAADRRMLGQLEWSRPILAASLVGWRAQNHYREVFAAFGVTVGAGQQDEAVRVLRASFLGDRLVLALNQWAVSAFASRAAARAVAPWRSLFDLLEKVDDNPDRRAVRRAMLAGREALAALARPQRLQAMDARGYDLLGACLALIGESESAIAVYRAGCRRFVGDYWLRSNLAMQLTHRPADRREVVTLLRTCRALRPRSVYAAMTLAGALADAGQFAAAEGLIERARELGGGSSYYWEFVSFWRRRRGDFAGALRAAERGLALNPNSLQGGLNRAEALFATGEIVKTSAQLESLLRAYPLSREVWELQGLVQQQRFDFARAERAFRRCLELGGDDPVAEYNLGVVLLRSHRPGPAARRFRRVVRARPKLAQAHCNLGAALLVQGELKAALVALRQGHALGSAQPGWQHPSGRWIAEAERLLALDPVLDRVARDGGAPPAADRAVVAMLAAYRGDWETAARLFAAHLGERKARVGPGPGPRGVRGGTDGHAEGRRGVRRRAGPVARTGSGVAGDPRRPGEG